MKLTKENVDRIFSECEWPFQEWNDKKIPIDQAPDGAMLLIPLPSGLNVATFHPEKLKQYSQEIGELLDQVPYLSQKTGISFSMLGRTVDGITWAVNPYEIQKLYLLGVATDQLISISINGAISIGRSPKDKSASSLVSVGEDGNKIIAKRFFMNLKK